MAIGPRVEDIPRIRIALGCYRVSAAITGVFLLLLVVMMIVRYGYGSDLAMGVPGSFITTLARSTVPGADPTGDWPPGAVNLSTIILIIHGWFYVAYLLIDFILWRLVRFSFGYFLFVALGGIIPFISFFFEYRVPKDIRSTLAALEASTAGSAA